MHIKPKAQINVCSNCDFIKTPDFHLRHPGESLGHNLKKSNDSKASLEYHSPGLQVKYKLTQFIFVA